MFVKRLKSGKKNHYYLYESKRVDGKVQSINLGSLGTSEQMVVKSLAKLLDAGKLGNEDFNRLAEPFDSDVWGTPDFILELVRQLYGGAIDLDVCTQKDNPTGAIKFYTAKDDGLTQKWSGNIWLNPPYSKPQPWLEKLVDEYQTGNVTQAVILVKAGVFQNKGTAPLIRTASAKLHWYGRLNFKPLRAGKSDRKSPDFDVAMAYWGSQSDYFSTLFGEFSA